MQFFNDKRKLLYLKLLVFELAVFVFDLTESDVKVGLQSLILGHANDILADLNNLKLQLLIFNCLGAQLITKRFNLDLHLVYLRLLSLSLLLQLCFILLQSVNLHQVIRNLLLKEFHNLFVESFLILNLPLQVINCLLKSLSLFTLNNSCQVHDHLSLTVNSAIVSFSHAFQLGQRRLLLPVFDAHMDRAIKHAVKDACI